MSDILEKIAIFLFTGVFFSVVGIFFRKWLFKNGIAQERIWDIFIFSFIVALVDGIWFQNLSWKWLVVIELTGITIGLNRMDIWYSAKFGKWWWKKDNLEKKSGYNSFGE